MDEWDIAYVHGERKGKTGLKHTCPEEFLEEKDAWLAGYAAGRMKCKNQSKMKKSHKKLKQQAHDTGSIYGICNYPQEDMPGWFSGIEELETIYNAAWKEGRRRFDELKSWSAS